MKKIILLGATGSIGTQTLDIIRSNQKKFKLVALSVGQNIKLAAKIINEFQPELVAVQRDHDCETLKRQFPHIKFVSGLAGLNEVAVYERGSILVNAVIGSVGLLPTLKAIEAKKTIAIANKETLVTAGHLVMDAARNNDVALIPVDSEHSAIFQALQGETNNEIERIILTASGGSFRNKTREQLQHVTVEETLQHPNWSMGAKITVDSATMVNKGLEVIEAHWLFDLPYEKIAVLLHRESIIHSLVEFTDSSVIAQLGSPDMRVPIQYALSYPERLPYQLGERLDLAKIGTLNFEEIDFERFRCLRFAYDAGKIGGTMPTIFNAANEVAVAAFLNKRISFLQIENLIEKALEKYSSIQNPSLETIQGVDKEVRLFIEKAIQN